MPKYEVVKKMPKGDGTWYKPGQTITLNASKAARGVSLGNFREVGAAPEDTAEPDSAATPEIKQRPEPTESKRVPHEPSPRTNFDPHVDQGTASEGTLIDPDAPTDVPNMHTDDPTDAFLPDDKTTTTTTGKTVYSSTGEAVTDGKGNVTKPTEAGPDAATGKAASGTGDTSAPAARKPRL
jgi:hypothetical protein